MALLFTSQPSLSLLAKSPSKLPSFSSNKHSLSFDLFRQHRPLRFPSLLSRSSLPPTPVPDPDPDEVPKPIPTPVEDSPATAPIRTDEWGEKIEPETETATRLADSDPPKDEDEWEERGGDAEDFATLGNNAAAYDTLSDLKRCLVDTVYETEFGFRAGSEIRGEVLELVNQLEALNPTPAPVEAPEVLDGNWVLLYTAFSELLPLLAAGTTPLLKVKSISQSIDSSSLSIVNSATLSSPFATFSFSASAAFEVRSPSRILVEFKEGTFRPPEIRPTIDLPENVDIFGQKINLSPVQQSLNPLQEVAANISRVISGQPPLRVPIPGNRTKSWLLITYLDKDLRISRGDGGLFVLAKEGSPLLDQ